MVIDEPIRGALVRLDQYAHQRNHVGPDPYDGLSSSIGRFVHSAHGRQLVVQAVKRSPLALRNLMRVPEHRMAKGLALFASGLQRAPFLPNATVRAARLTGELIEMRKHGGWGYEFDVQTRWAHYPANSPNIIATAFVLEALHDNRIVTDLSETLEWLKSSMIHPDGYIRYVPGSNQLIHNANMLGARALFRLDPDNPAILQSVATTLANQLPDGHWYYGTSEDLSWVDNFHTTYVLLTLNSLRTIDRTVDEALDRGIAAWTRDCFEPTGVPKYYAHRKSRTDIHNVATAIQGLATFATRHPICVRLLPGAVEHLLSLQRSDGAFVAHRWEPPYMRWNQGHAFRALAEISQLHGNL